MEIKAKIVMLKGEKGEQGDLNHNDIIDNLTSTATNKVLSANQGKALKDLMDDRTYYILSTDYLNPTNNDNSVAFTNMLTDALNSNKSIIIKEGNYKFTKHIEMSSTVHILGEGKVIFDFTNFDDETDYCIKIMQKTTYAQYGDSFINKALFDNITFKGYEWGQGGTPSSNYLNKNLFFIITHTFTLANLTIYGFNKAFTYGSDSYVIDVLNSVIISNNYGIYYDRASYTNSGERLSFTNCTICNNNVGFYIDRAMMSFINCSIDYNGKISDKVKTMSSGVTDGHVNFIGCHFEDVIHDSSIDRFIIDNGQVEFTGCGFWFGSLPFLKSTDDKDLILIENCLIRGENVPDAQTHDNYFIDSNYNNVLINGLFTRTPQNNIKISKNYNLIKNYNALVANIQDGSIALNDGVLTLTNDPYKSAYTSTNMINIPYGKGNLNCKFDIKSNYEVTAYSKFIEFYDDNDTLLSNVAQNWNLNTDYQLKHYTVAIPLEATKCVLYFNSPGGSNKITDIKNIYVSFN